MLRHTFGRILQLVEWVSIIYYSSPNVRRSGFIIPEHFWISIRDLVHSRAVHFDDER